MPLPLLDMTRSNRDSALELGSIQCLAIPIRPMWPSHIVSNSSSIVGLYHDIGRRYCRALVLVANRVSFSSHLLLSPVNFVQFAFIDPLILLSRQGLNLFLEREPVRHLQVSSLAARCRLQRAYS